MVESGKTLILVDAGFGPREMSRRLERLGLVPADIDAVLVTHEHSDHVGGVFACARKFDWSVLLTHGTLAGCRYTGNKLRITVIDSHEALAIDGLRVFPFPVPHDAREPVQFVIDDGAGRRGVLTAAGHITSHMVEVLGVCDALVLECNHDAVLLAEGSYPMALKKRIGGRWGHLDNAAAADLLSRLSHLRLRHVVAAHLSEENNRPEFARAALSAALGCEQSWIGVATQDDGFSWREL